MLKSLHRNNNGKSVGGHYAKEFAYEEWVKFDQRVLHFSFIPLGFDCIRFDYYWT